MRRRTLLSTLFSAFFALAAGFGRLPAAQARSEGKPGGTLRIVDGWLLKEEDL